MIRIVVPGPPVGKGRPRFVRATGRAHTPPRTANYEAILSWYGQAAMNGAPAITGPVQIDVQARMPLAASWSKRKRAEALSGARRPGKPDADNLLKVLDALNGIVWLDDAQIADARIRKFYAEHPCLEIEVTEL